MSPIITDGWTLDVFTSTIHRGKVGLWSWDPETRTARFDDLSRTFWGDLSSPDQTLDTLFERIDPRDRDEAVRAWLASADSPGPYEYDFRIPQGGSHRWISARGVGGDEGRLNGKVLAVFVDVTAQRSAEEALEALVGEMGHRVANLFGVASAMVGLTAREADTTDAMAADLQSRFGELRSAFTYAVKRSEHGLAPTPLPEILRELLSPYARGGERVVVDVPGDILVSGDRITDIALVVHELATNSLKYGSLGVADGMVEVSGTLRDDDVRLRWNERGGKPLHDLPKPTGFGSRLVDHTVMSVLGGSIERQVEDGGLAVYLVLDRQQLVS